MKKTYYLLLLLTLSSPAFSQVFSYGTPLAPNAAEKLSEDKDVQWTELSSKRTLFSSQFVDNKGNTKGVFSKKAIHYTDKQGKLKPIDASLTYTGSKWTATAQQFPTALYPDGSYSISLDEEGTSVRMGITRRVNGVSYPIAVDKNHVNKSGCNIYKYSICDNKY